MIKKSIIFLAISIILGFCILILAPIRIISSDLSSYGKIEDEFSIIYAPSSPTSTQGLYLNVDVGDIEVRYVYPPINYVMKIEMELNMMGVNLSGKSLSDIFTISQQNTSSSLNLTVLLKTNSWFDDSLVIIQNLKIIVYLNADFLHNIYCNVNYEGNFEIQVPWDITIKNIHVEVNEGNILFSFLYCIISGNITGVVGFGDIELIANDVKYTQNNRWTLINDDGIIRFNIIQNRAMEANLTGTGKTKNGEIKIQYRDSSPNIGAKFTFNNYTGTWGGIFNTWEGFPEDPESFYDLPNVGYIFTSFDFQTIENYNLSLYKPFTSGGYSVNLSSIPVNP